MLRSASIALAARSRALTSVARTRRSLDAFDRDLADGTGRHHELVLDWSIPDVFLNAIHRHLASVGPPDLAVGWFHDDALGLQLAIELGAFASPCRFFQVLGSTAADPTAGASSLLSGFRPPNSVSYHQAVLGFVREGG